MLTLSFTKLTRLFLLQTFLVLGVVGHSGFDLLVSDLYSYEEKIEWVENSNVQYQTLDYSKAIAVNAYSQFDIPYFLFPKKYLLKFNQLTAEKFSKESQKYLLFSHDLLTHTRQSLITNLSQDTSFS